MGLPLPNNDEFVISFERGGVQGRRKLFFSAGKQLESKLLPTLLVIFQLLAAAKLQLCMCARACCSCSWSSEAARTCTCSLFSVQNMNQSDIVILTMSDLFIICTKNSVFSFSCCPSSIPTLDFSTCLTPECVRSHVRENGHNPECDSS